MVHILYVFDSCKCVIHCNQGLTWVNHTSIMRVVHNVIQRKLNIVSNNMMATLHLVIVCAVHTTGMCATPRGDCTPVVG